ncbi:MAG: hypothetical protein Q8S38_11415 [Bosea sp. (in: a-proteobacteria)]|nr:hypothetical protein [Bosea sp. (in: a-proteobacteria)]
MMPWHVEIGEVLALHELERDVLPALRISLGELSLLRSRLDHPVLLHGHRWRDSCRSRGGRHEIEGFGEEFDEFDAAQPNFMPDHDDGSRRDERHEDRRPDREVHLLVCSEPVLDQLQDEVDRHDEKRDEKKPFHE